MRAPSSPMASAPRARPTRRALALCAALALFAAACRSPGSSSSAAAAPSGAAAPSAPASPSWRYQPLSWAKLGEIERWLAAPQAHSDPALYSEARLVLAEGLIEYAELEQAKLSPSAFDERLDRAEELLHAVHSEAAPGPAQHARAEAALARALRARIGSAPPPALAQAPAREPASSAPGGAELIQRARWGALPVNPARLERHQGAWERITVHHSADINGELAEHSAKDSAQAVRNIQRYHMQSLHWGDIAYHFLIDPKGRVYEGRSLKWQGAHAGSGDLNYHNIGICLLGDFASASERPSQEALSALDGLVDSLCARYRIGASHVYGHQEVKSSTMCPGPYLLGWVKRYRAGAAGEPAAKPAAKPQPKTVAQKSKPALKPKAPGGSGVR